MSLQEISYKENLKKFLDFWNTCLGFQIVKNHVHNILQNKTIIHDYRMSLTPHLQNKLKKLMLDIEKTSPEIDKPITVKLRHDLCFILNECNAFSILPSNDDELVEISKTIQNSWYALHASIQNLYSCTFP